MPFKIDDAKLWVYYVIHQKYLKQAAIDPGLMFTVFCEDYDITVSALSAYIYRYENKQKTNPEMYKEIKEAYEDFTAKRALENLSYLQYTQRYAPRINPNHLYEFKTHISYRNKIEYLKNNPPCSEEEVLQKLWIDRKLNPLKKPVRARKSYQRRPNNELSFLPMGANSPLGYPVENITSPVQEEVVIQSDDLEIIVKKGIKISVSPFVDEATILKLITTIRKL